MNNKLIDENAKLPENAKFSRTEHEGYSYYADRITYEENGKTHEIKITSPTTLNEEQAKVDSYAAINQYIETYHKIPTKIDLNDPLDE